MYLRTEVQGLDEFLAADLRKSQGKREGLHISCLEMQGQSLGDLGMWLQGQKSFHCHSSNSRGKRRDLSTNKYQKKGAEGLCNNCSLIVSEISMWIKQKFP